MTALSVLAQQGFQFSWDSFLIILFVLISLVMVLVVLIQRPQGGGLSGAFGAASDGAGQTAFGAKTGDALTFATITTFVLFLACAIGLNFVLRPADASVTPSQVAPATPANTTTGTGTAGDPLTFTDSEGNPITLTPADPNRVPGPDSGLGASIDTGAGDDAPVTPDDPAEPATEPATDPAPDDQSTGG